MPEAVPDHAYVLRRAHETREERLAFAPTKDDTEGISVFWESSEVTPDSIAKAARKPPKEYRVLRLKVAEVRRLGLSVILDEPPPRHCVIPEINTGNYKKTKDLQSALFRVSEEAELFFDDPS